MKHKKVMLTMNDKAKLLICLDESMASLAEGYGLGTHTVYDFKKINLETMKAFSCMQSSEQNKGK